MIRPDSTTDNRYKGTDVLTLNGTRYYARRTFQEWPEREDDQLHTVIEEDRLDILAYEYLGDAGLWWVIADYNQIRFPLEIPSPGTVLRIPSKSFALMEITPNV